MKKNRQEKILELVKAYPIGTQDELIERLREEGYVATQATVSRDIRALKLVKLMLEGGGYRYVLPRQEGSAGEKSREGAYQKTHTESILSVAYAMNNVVIKTTPGMASAVALMLDQNNHEWILGTVAGDDTVIVVTRSTEDSVALTESIEAQRD